MLKALLFSSLVLNAGLLLGRLAGFAREAFVASTYGATAEADIVVLMLTVPDLLVGILMGGAMGAALVPEFSQRPGQARQLLYQSALFFGSVFLGVATVCYWQTDLLVSLLVPGFSEGQADKASVTLGWVVWLIPLTVLAGVVTAYLHAHNRFAVAALGTLIINCSIIAGLVSVNAGYGGLYLLAIFVLLGGGLRLLSQLSQVRLTWKPLHSLRKGLLNRALLTRYGQAMLSGSALLLFPVVARAMASLNGEGSVALFNYAVRLIEFPLAVAVTFLAVVFFPRLAQSYNNDTRLHHQQIRYGVQITLALSLSAMIALILLSDAYTEVVFGYGDMQTSNLLQITSLIGIGLLALPLQGLSSFLTAVFNARKNTRTPLCINVAGLLFFLAISSTEILGQGLAPLMWGMVMSYGLICLLQLIFIKIEAFSWLGVFFGKTFLLGNILGLASLGAFCQWISQAGLSAWLSILTAMPLTCVCLGVVALFNNELRASLKARLGIK